MSTFPIRKLPAELARVETGPVQFGDDWPGTFIRGDDCPGMARLLKQLMETTAIPGGDRLFLDLIIEALESSNLNRRNES